MRYPKVAVSTEHGMHITNYLSFVDDLKLFTEDDEKLKAMAEVTQRFFTVVGLEISQENAVTNLTACTNTAVLLEGPMYINTCELWKTAQASLLVKATIELEPRC
ncbi:hypothetical protein PAEPH01_2363 [Pancytospora epiphaga]|nr:hypothetical protein PAEPH01_2363 [Pancytospora epiphaga]